jgi:hypothetical protein
VPSDATAASAVNQNASKAPIRRHLIQRVQWNKSGHPLDKARTDTCRNHGVCPGGARTVVGCVFLRFLVGLASKDVIKKDINKKQGLDSAGDWWLPEAA